MPENEFRGLLPENFEDFRSLEYWDGFFKARGNKVGVTRQRAVVISPLPTGHHGNTARTRLVLTLAAMGRPLSGMVSGNS